MTTTAPKQSRPARAGRLRGWALRLAELAASPLLPADYLDIVNPLRAGADLRGRVERVHAETRDSVTLVIRPGRDWAGHAAGQYVRLGVDVDGVRLWRAYSMTSPPRPDGLITVTVKAMPDGKVSNHLVRGARPGLVVHLDQATGTFTLPGTPVPKALFITAGSGITPVMGMLRAADRAALPDVVVLHSAPTPDEVIFADELRALAAAGRVRLVLRHTDTEGMLDVAELAELVPDLAEREAWACGPTGLLDALEEHYAERGACDRLHTERFRPTVLVTGDGGEVTFARTGAVVESGPATTLLDAGEAAGVLMPSGCRMGVCFGCVAPLREGAVRDLRDGRLTTAAPGDGVLIQTCVSAAAGPCHIDL